MGLCFFRPPHPAILDPVSRYPIVKRLTLLSIFSLTFTFTYGQDSLRMNDEIIIPVYASEDHPRSFEMMFFPRFGMGFRYRKHHGFLSEEYSFYAFDDQWVSLKNRSDYVHHVSDTSVYMIAENRTVGEFGLKGGISHSNPLIAVSLNAMFAMRESREYYNYLRLNYQLDTLNNQYLYYTEEGGLVSNPDDSMVEVLDQGFRNTKHLKFGLSPAFEFHIRSHRTVFSAMMAFDITYNVAVQDVKRDFHGVYIESAKNSFSNNPRLYFTVGRTF